MNTLRVGILLTALTALFVVVGGMLGGQGGMVIALGLALVMNVGSFWFSDKLVIKMTRAQPVSEAEAPDLHAMVARLAQRAGIPKPALYVVPDPQPNAFATGRSPARGVVAVNQGLLDVLDAREVEGVIAHEIGHIRHRDTLTMAVVASLAGAVMMLANMAQWAAMFGGLRGDDDDDGGGIVGLLVAIIVAPLAAMLIQTGISRAREFEADAAAADYTGSPDGLASALLKLERGASLIPSETARPATAHLNIVNPLRAGSRARFAGLFSTHPPVEARIERLMQHAGRVAA